MPAYRYRAAHASGRVSKGVASASNEAELAQALRATQLELIEARVKKESSARLTGFRWVRRGVSHRVLTLFCAQVADLLKAGMAFLDVLTDLTLSMPPGDMRDTLQDVTRSLSHGSRIADAFARHPRLFPPVFIAILASGEVSGDITRAFEQLALYVEGRARMNERLSRALRYPLFLFAVAGGVVTFMMVLVVPQIVSFLQSIDSQLPVATRILIAVSHLFAALWWMAGLVMLFVGIVAAGFYRHSAGAARFLDGLLLRIPAIGAVVQKLMLARFAQSLAILVQSGLNIPESLAGARDTLGNRALEARLDEAREQIASGRPLSSAMSELFPPFSARILRIGEQGGRLAKSLADIATHYDREAADSAERMMGGLEPTLTLLVGGLLAWVVLAVLGPIYSSLSQMNVVG